MDAALLARATRVAEAFHAEHGRPISRDALGRALHVGNRAAGQLLRALRNAPAQDGPAGNGAGPRLPASGDRPPRGDGSAPDRTVPAAAAPSAPTVPAPVPQGGPS